MFLLVGEIKKVIWPTHCGFRAEYQMISEIDLQRYCPNVSRTDQTNLIGGRDFGKED